MLAAVLSCTRAAFPPVCGSPLPQPDEFAVDSSSYFTLCSPLAVIPTDESLNDVAGIFSEEFKAQTGCDTEVRRRAGKGIVLKISGKEPEAYAIDAGPGGITVSGTDPQAVYRGLTTLRQIVGVPDTERVRLPSMTVTDAPVYAWRGLSLDVSRHFLSKEEVCRVIDMMALYKLNVLHLHLTDNQGWRIEIPGYPALTPGTDHYSLADFREIVSYAGDHFVTVVPEIDLPGHTKAVFDAFPDFPNAASSPLPFDLPGQAIACLDPDDEATMQFVTTVIDLLCGMAPGEYVHIGGDETFGMNDDKYGRFVVAVKEMVRVRGKKVAGWQEMARAGVDSLDLVQHWIRFSSKQRDEDRAPEPSIPLEVRKMLGATYLKAPSDLRLAQEAGAGIILSPNAWAYLDCPFEESSTDAGQNLVRERLGLRQYAAQSLTELYDWEPAEIYKDFNVVGLEAAVWCETVTCDGDLEMLLLPRLAGVAERAWSHPEDLSCDDYLSRLASQAAIWEKEGWDYFKVDSVF